MTRRQKKKKILKRNEKIKEKSKEKMEGLRLETVNKKKLNWRKRVKKKIATRRRKEEKIKTKREKIKKS